MPVKRFAREWTGDEHGHGVRDKEHARRSGQVRFGGKRVQIGDDGAVAKVDQHDDEGYGQCA